MKRTALTIAALLLVTATAHAGEWKQRRVTYLTPVGWEALTEQVLADWTSCGVLTLLRVKSREDVPIVVDDFGYTLWVGQGSQLTNSKGWTVAGRITINQWWLDNGMEEHKQFVLCHEVGHTLGIPHINVVESCMMANGISGVPGSSGCAALRTLYGR